MSEAFDPIEYLNYLMGRWRFAAVAIVAAGLTALLACWLMPAQYTATASLVIEPPGGTDPRTSTAVSAVYLESLKTYEEFATSNTLFAKAYEKFHLLENGAGSIEGLKARVLRVVKPKDTKVLQISVTLPDPKRAQALVQFLAEETVALNRSLTRLSEGDSRAELEKQLDRVRGDLDRARTEQAAVESSGSALALDEDIRANAELRSRTSEQLVAATALLAELSTQGDSGSTRADINGTRARIAALTAERSALEKESVAKAQALAALRAKLGRTSDQLRSAQTAYETLSGRANDLIASSGMRSEQLRIIDPGVVPQQPSFPKPALLVGAAMAIGTLLSLVFLTVGFGLSRRRGGMARPELKVARGGGR